jgi:ferritin-like metal-binding protein YciE
MESSQEQIITWLRDAHAMERNMESVLERHLKDAQDYPALREQLEKHLNETRDHARRIETALESLGATASGVKDLAAGFMGAVQGMSTSLFRDEPVKNALAAYAMEHLEIATYSSLIAAAEDANLVDLSHLCSDILREETAMALWLEDQIPAITRQYLEHAPSAS